MRLEPCDAGETGAIRSTWQSDLDPTRRSGRRVTDGVTPFISTPVQSESGNGRTGTGIDPNSATESLRFHTDFTQIDRPGPHSARRLANPTTHQCP